MGEIAYHDTVNELHGLGLCGKGPFARVEWFGLLEQAQGLSGQRPFIALASDASGAIALPLIRRGKELDILSNWYAFTWAPLETAGASPALLDALAGALRAYSITLTKLDAADTDRLEAAFRRAGFFVSRDICDTNHFLAINGRSFAEYLASRPGPLRTTLKRKAKKVEVRLSRHFDAADWAAYEAIYAASWKPAEGDPALLRAFARQESARGHYLFGMALADGQPVAAQFWTVEDGTAYIHKLAHLPAADALSPGTTLTAALMEQVIDRDRVAQVDFGTGNDSYKADWMDAARPRFALTCIHPAAPRHWLQLGKALIRHLVSPHSDG
ncbi:GNAT family N-acetyltransferase [Alteraurantiacibacter palmitatis]|uniref:GNAT family N-acetyltransferase n=1 Tax=Alteraurantiacibacter palmitatis TaxID=2054628 RepID=A0ABV7E441_9SPHN